ncbi:MAG: glycoside hydrolase family 3 C-terminal domain-containing protein [Acidobacteria bacterium]|nr:glycoside hydrolase family 3 C-terminal domain-containing protein [Acidobacteriota bacterium]
MPYAWSQRSAMAKAHTPVVSNPQLASPAIEQRVEALLKKMTLEEKLGQLVQYNDQGVTAPTTATENVDLAANPEAHYKIDAMQLAATGRMGSMLNVVGAAKTNMFQKAAIEKSRLHIPILFGADVIHGFRTIYPVPLGLAASFDPELVTELSAMSAQEATTAGIRWFYSPMVDIARDARWGRVTEGAGEDPYLGAAMARAYIKGYQGASLSDPSHVAASVKHFAAYGAAEAGREYFTTDMSISRLHQVYLPPYKAAVEAGAATMMSAFNSLNGVPATADRYLLQDVLRNRWHFNGFVVSDYTAVMELIQHGTALDAAAATAQAITAGTDVDMMSHFYDAQLPKLVRSGKVSMAVIDEAVRRVLRVKFALGLFEQPYPTAPEITSAVDEHRPLVRRAAEESFVLLQNKPIRGVPLLPLSNKAQTVALVGPLADNANEMHGAWGGGHHPKDVVTVKQAFEARAAKNGGKLLFAKGTDILSHSDAGFAEALQIARQADVIVLALGESGMMSGEAGSRAHLNLPGNQQQLLESIAELHKPTILLVFSGRPLVLTWAANHIDAIMETWFPGTEAGNAIVNVLYGDAAPSGKLPVSFPYAVGQEPLYYAQFPTGRPPLHADLMVPPTGNSRFISRYIDAPNEALFPFGFGLTYTSFGYSPVQLSGSKVPLASAKRSGNVIVATATLTNTGDRTATEIVQCYVRNRGASLEQPIRELKGFQRITLSPGESRQVSFPLGFHELSFFNNEGAETVEPTRYTVWINGSSDVQSAGAEFQIVQ